MVSRTPIRSVSVLSMVFIGSIFLTACGPIVHYRWESMESEERLAELQAYPTDKLCYVYSNIFIQPQTESQIAGVLQSRGVKVCETARGTRIVPGSTRSTLAQVSDDLGETQVDSQTDPTNTQLAINSEPGNSFKGVELGMSLDKFMQMEFADKNRLPMGSTKIPRSFRTQCKQSIKNLRHCWFEAWWNSRAPTCRKDMDGIRRHLNLGREQYTKAGAIRWANKTCYRRIDVGYGGSSPSYGSYITYVFFNNRLMTIYIKISPAKVKKLIPKLIEAYGEPTTTDTSFEQNAFGALFENQIFYWDNGETIIIAKHYAGSIDRGYFSYTHKATERQFDAQNAEANSRAAKDF